MSIHAWQFEKIVVLTGAGISAESGISTFRDSGGLWEHYRIEEVATPEAFEKDPALVWSFYSARRKTAGLAQPNAAHHALARFALFCSEAGKVFTLITQNVDGLHERAHSALGASAPITMHGTLPKSRCTECGKTFVDDRIYLNEKRAPVFARAEIVSEASLGFAEPARDKRGLPLSPCCNSILRPHIVWFGEIPIDIPLIESRLAHLGRQDLFVTVGTSGNVYPAAGFLSVAKAAGATTVCINPEPIPQQDSVTTFLQGTATSQVPLFFEPRLKS